MINRNYILDLLKMQENNIKITDVKILDDHIEVYAVLLSDHNDIACPKCGSVNNNIHAYHVRKIKHSNTSGKPVIIFLKQ